MKVKKIQFYFDFLSPYSYLAWTKIRNMEYEFEYLPVSLPNIISHYETKGPGQIKPKRDFLTRDLLRYKTLHNIKFNFPPTLPFNSLYALRLSLVGVANQCFVNQKQLINIFFEMCWGEGLDLSNVDLIETKLKSINLDSDNLLNLIATKEIKLELRKNIEMAISRGVFGVPTFIVVDEFDHEELFWGNDSINYLELYLTGNDPLPLIEYQNYLTNFPM
jgi:2-hydroxychromene-2-carboxylate isomerase